MKSTLIVRTGGGLPGLDVHVGYWLALEAAGIVGTALHGTSAGAIVSALDATGWTAPRAHAEILRLADADIRDERPAWKIRFPWIESIMRGEKYRALLNDFFPTGVLRPNCHLHVYATRMPHGQACASFDPAPLAEAVAASCAIPAMWPRVTLAGADYVDGGVVRNVPLPADWRHFDRVIICDATLDDPDPAPWRNRALSNAIGALRMMMRNQVNRVAEETRGNPRVTWLQLRGVRDQGLLHFSHDLIETARRYATEKLRR